MNKKINKKLSLNKITVQSLDIQLDREEQKNVNGGSNNSDAMTTVTPVFCKP